MSDIRGSVRSVEGRSGFRGIQGRSEISLWNPGFIIKMYLVTLLILTECAIIVLPQVCRISEFLCKNNKCIRLDRYCNKVNDCGDKSDEPPFCTVCNRTFYGDAGITYELDLPKPREDRLPFLCHLTFTANGHNYGDFLQLLFDAFNVGKFEEQSYYSCPDGYMQIMELGRPFTGGSWCGTSSGLAVYYSETSTITITIKLFHFREDSNFQFKLRYRFLQDNEAVARFGSLSEPIERGEQIPGTYCSRIFYECSKKKCRLQSPNFPGMYPRNVTCHLNLRQKEVPTCKHAMISVKQENSYKIHIKRSVVVASVNKTKSLRTWNDCSDNEDHLIFYDGSSTSDPVLVKFCGGDWLPRIMSRGSEMLIVFQSTPYSVPPDNSFEKFRNPFLGFELDVDVMFVDSDSFDYKRESLICEFWVNASNPEEDGNNLKGRSGHIYSPRHTLPPNTTCTWHFKGLPDDLVWIYFFSYVQENLVPSQNSQEISSGSNKKFQSQGDISKKLTSHSKKNCSTSLLIWDGGGKTGHSLVLGEYCDFNVPKLCDHSSLENLTRTTRPCTLRESYLSIGSNLMMQLYTEKGTAINSLFFKLKYEFVDTRLGGEQWNTKRTDEFVNSPCLRVFRRKKRGTIRSPRNIFFFGKGGAKNLSCIYRIEGSPSERVKINILNASFGENSCFTDKDSHSNRPKCIRDPNVRHKSELLVFEAPWKDVLIPHACFCDNATNEHPFSFTFASRAIEIHFKISKFNSTDDFLDFFFNAKYELIKNPECTRRQKVGGSGGEISFTYPPTSSTEINCYGMPWVVEGYQNMSLFLLTWGTFMEFEPTQEEIAKCPTKNRILIYSGKPARLLRIVCPRTPNSHHYAVHIFSEEWFTGASIPSPSRSGLIFHLEPPRPPSFIVEFVGFEEGIAQLNWLEISRTRRSYLQQLQLEHILPKNSTNQNFSSLLPWDCQYKCPELNACISESLWCDGRLNCPSGYDESEIHCGFGHKFISLIPGGMYAILGASAAILTFVCLFLGLVIAFKIRNNKNDGDKTCDGGHRNGPPKRVLTDELLLDPESTTSS